MNWIDIILFTGMAVLCFRGWQMGLLRSILHYFALVLGITLSLKLWQQLASLLSEIVPGLPNFTYPIIVISVLIIGTLVLFWLTGLLIARWLDPTPLGKLDRLGGILLGAFKFFLVLLLLAFLCSFLPQRPAWTKPFHTSLLLEQGQKALPWVGKVTPKHWQKNLPPKFRSKD